MTNANEIINTKQKQEHKLRFWLFQLCGWLPFYGLMLPLFGDDYALSSNSLLFAFSMTVFATLGSLQLRWLFKFLSHKTKKNSVMMLAIFFGGIPIAMIVGVVHQGFWFVFSQMFSGFNSIYQSQPYSIIAGVVWFVYLFWSSLYLLLIHQEKLSKAVIKQQRLELLITENKINRLLEQLNPHFMFNTINNIRALILSDTDKARDMLSSFADIMRYQMNSNNHAMVPLKDELDFVLEFIELNRLQLGKRLNFSMDIDDSLLNNVIPRMGLQLLVENAIKHGFSQSAKPAILKISIKHCQNIDNSEAWFLSVQNNGTINSDKTNSGIGLKNLTERLKLSVKNNYKFMLTEENNVVEAKILFSH